MLAESVFQLTITFALIAGTAATLLAILTWEVFRQSQFGRAIFFLSFCMSIFILYHAVLLALEVAPIYTKVVESIVYTGFVIVIWSIAITHPAWRGHGE